MMNIRQNKGFTLIELMIVVSVIAVLAIIAYPSFLDAVRKARRSDAMDGIASIRLAQEKFRANCIEYAGALVDSSNDTCDNATPANNKIRSPYTSKGNEYYSADEYYKLTLSSADHMSYIIRATPRSKGHQDKDKCGYFELKINKPDASSVVQAVQKLTGSGDADRCWKR